MVLVLLVPALWFTYLYLRITQVAATDEARSADAIAVFGAAQYQGHPSPVFHARLDHAAALFDRGMAPLIVTLGGSGEHTDAQTEGNVGRDYLLAQGVPYDRIVAETESSDTEQQVEQLGRIARSRRLSSIIVVSDPTHLFRIRQLCQDQGLTVYTSPRAPLGNISDWQRTARVWHEMISYTALRLHVDVSWMHRWLEGKEEL